MRAFLLLPLVMLTWWGCNSSTCHKAGLCVDCHAVCQRMVECSVSFGGSERGPGGGDSQSRCERGCLTTDTITPEREQCILDVDPSDETRCQKQVIGCLGADAGPLYQ